MNHSLFGGLLTELGDIGLRAINWNPKPAIAVSDSSHATKPRQGCLLGEIID